MAVASALLAASPAAAQRRPQQTRPAPAPVPAPAQTSLTVPDHLTLSKLLWSTMAAVDHANKTGNYSVLRSLGSPGFQRRYDVNALSATFAGIRQTRLDLADTLLIEPLLEFPPAIQGGLLRMRGAFRMRPTGVRFDLLYQWNNGWALEGVAMQPLATTAR
jgi:hypothetical protein